MSNSDLSQAPVSSMRPLVDSELCRSLSGVAAALRRDVAGEASDADNELVAMVAVERLAGGRNNWVYGCVVGGESFCVKLYRCDGRLRDRREWATLAVLARAGLDVVPAPVLYEPGPGPALVLTRLPGTGLGEQRLTPDHVGPLGEAFGRLQSVVPSGEAALRLLPVNLPEDAMVERASRFWADRTDLATPLRRQLAARWQEWAAGDDLAILGEPAPCVLGQGDPNLSNCLWDGETMRLVDFEYSGQPTTQAYELALLIEHVKSRATPDELWENLLDELRLSSRERRRVFAARRLVAWFWLQSFWPDTAVDDDRFTGQADRVLHLQEPAGR